MEIERKELLNALNVASKLAGRNAMFPVIACVKIDGDEKTISATDLETSAVIPLTSMDQSAGEKVVVDCRRLTEMVKALDDEKVSISVNNDMSIDVNNVYKGVAVIDEDDFPNVSVGKPDPDVKTSVKVSNLKAVVAAAAKPGSGTEHLSTVRFDATTQSAVATDGSRLHMTGADVAGESWSLPVSSLPPILAAAGKDTGDLVISFYGVDVKEGVDVDDTMLDGLTKSQLISLAEDYFGKAFTSKEKVGDIRDSLMAEMKIKAAVEKSGADRYQAQINGTTVVVKAAYSMFPDYKPIIPRAFEHEVKITREGVDNALKQSKVMVDSKYRRATLTFNCGIDMEVQNPEMGTFHKANIPVVSGAVNPAVSLDFDPSFIMDAINTASDKTAEISVGLQAKAQVRALSIRHGDFTALVMPMRG